MRGLFLDGRALSYRSDLPVPSLEPGWALVRVERAGICSTDLQLAAGLYDFHGIPGHEFVGIVERVAGTIEEETKWSGQRVVGEINIACGRCDLCLRELGKHCRQRLVLGIREHHGAFAELLTLPLVNLHRVPPELDADTAVLTEPLAAVFDILDKVEFQPATTVAIVGDGRLAQLAARVLLGQVETVAVLGRYPDKLNRLPAGSRGFLEPPAGMIHACDVVVECSGSAAGLGSALELVRPGGKVILKSTHREPLPLPTEAIVVNEITLLGSRCGNFPRALKFLCDLAGSGQKKTRISRTWSMRTSRSKRDWQRFNTPVTSHISRLF